jgi:hypothetical protein
MAVITQDEVKTLLQITDSSKDDLIDALIPIIEDDIREYCNQNFQDAPLVPSWQVWMKLPVSKMIYFNFNASLGNGLKSESQGEYSYTRDENMAGYPAGLMKAFDKAKVARIQQTKITGQYREMRGFTEQQIAAGYEFRGSADNILNESIP